jgi:magnesium-transporting ATPase (P-type)
MGSPASLRASVRALLKKTDQQTKGTETAMPTKVMKWGSIAALLILATLNSRSLADYRTVLAALVVFAGAIVVLVQSTSRGKYLWATAFLAVGVLFNPALPIMLPRNTFVMLELVSLVLFAASLAALKRIPRQSIASITDRTPGSQSL